MNEIIFNGQWFEGLVKPIAVAAALFSIVFFIIISIILNYHWLKYEINNKQVLLMRFIYFTVSALIFYAMVVVGMEMFL